MFQMLTMKTKGMKKEIRVVILHDEMLNDILMEEGEGYLSKHVMQIRSLLTSESKRTGPIQMLAAILLSNGSSF